MLKKILILFCGLLLINFNVVQADTITTNEIVDDLKSSDVVFSMERQNHKIEINDDSDKIIIVDEYDNNKYETIFEYDNDSLTYSSNKDKEILKESTVWIDEITRIVLSKFSYSQNTIDNINISDLTFEDNGLEGVRNAYVIDNHEIYYYFYYKISLSNVNLDKDGTTNTDIVTNNSNTTTNEIKEDTNYKVVDDSSNNRSNISSYTIYIEVFCMIIAVLMLILNSATKNQ